MKLKYKITLFLCFLTIGFSSAQNWIWSKQIGGNGLDGAGPTCIDANNNLYVTGSFYSNPCFFNSDTLSPNGISDFFIAKYDASGNELWVKGFGGPNNLSLQPEGISSISYDAVSDCIYFTGSFFDSCAFDSITVYSSGGNSDAFIAKLGLNGNIIWVIRAGGICDDGGITSAPDRDGNIIVEYGLCASGTIDTSTVTAGVYFVKYDLNGNCLWVKKKFNYINSTIQYDAVIVKMQITDDKIFGVGKCHVDTFIVDTISVFANYPNGQCFISCFDTATNPLWIKTCGGPDAINLDMKIDNTKNNYVIGNFDQEGIFENDTLHSVLTDLFITKYDSTGQKIWVFQTNSTNGAIGSSLYFDPEGNFYSTGTVYGTAVFGNDTINPSITSMILARFDTSGNCIGVRFEGLATGMNVAVDGSGNAYVNGGFYNSISFDSNPTMTSYGSGDIYIAKSSAIVGIGERESPGRNELLIYANPTTGKCNVNIPGEFEHEKKLTLSIFDTNGKLIQQKPIQMSEDKIRLNLEAEAKGIYNVTLTNGKKVYNGRIVFE